MTPGEVGTNGEPTWSSAPNPTRRPVLRSILTAGVVATLFLVSLLILLGILGATLESQAAVTAVLMALVPLLIVVPTFLWLDRYEAEPGRYLVFALLWGALVAVVGAFWLNTLGLRLLVESQWIDPMATGSVYLAPVVEETLKGLGILLIFLFRRRECDGVVDGIVYGGLIGAGFAFSENVLYLGRALTEYGPEGFTATFIVRGLMGPFAHPLFTSITGIGIGMAVMMRSRNSRIIAIVAGWVCAMLLHGTWNFAAVAGAQGFLNAYLTIQVPLFLAYVGFLFWLRRREGRLIGQYLSPYADAGWLTHNEVLMLSHLRARKGARAWAGAHGGRAARRSMHAFQDSASDLALLRARMVRGTAEPDAAERQRVLLDAMTEHRRAFVGTPVA